MRKNLVRARASFFSSFALNAPGLVVGALALAACGKPPPVAPPPVSEKPKPVEIVAEAPPDISPVGEPKGLVAFGRIAHAEASANTVIGWTGMAGVIPGAGEAIGAVFGEDLKSVVDLASPIDFAVRVAGNVRAPSAQVVVSIPLVSLDAARSKLGKYTMTPMPNGVIKVEGLAPPPKDESDEPRVCVMAATAGAARARLVCGDQGGVESLGPYALRTLAVAPSKSDVHVEMHFGAVRDSVEGVRRLLPALAGGLLDNAKGTGIAMREIIEATVADVADFAVDSDRLTLDLDTKPEGARATLRYSFRTQKATLTKLMVTGAKDVGPPPPALLGLPADVDMAAWTRAGDPTLFDRPRRLFAAFLDETLASELPPPDRKAVVDLLANRTLPIFQGGMVFGRGYDLDALKSAAATRANDGAPSTPVAAGAARARGALFGTQDSEPQRAAREMAVVSQGVGYSLMRFERPASEVALVTKDWVNLGIKLMRAKNAKTKGARPEPTMRVGGAPPGVKLPQGTTHLELLLPRPQRHDAKGKPTFTPPPVVAHVFIAPSDSSAPGTSWMAVGLDAKLVASRMVAARTPTGPTLGTRPESRELLASASRSGFLVTPRLVALARFVDHKERALGALGQEGFASILATSAPEAPSQDAVGGAVVTTIHVPKEAIGAGVGLMMQGR